MWLRRIGAWWGKEVTTTGGYWGVERSMPWGRQVASLEWKGHCAKVQDLAGGDGLAAHCLLSVWSELPFSLWASVSFSVKTFLSVMVSTSEGFCEDPVTTEDTVWDYYCEVRQSQICLDPTSSAWDCQSKEGSGAGIRTHLLGADFSILACFSNWGAHSSLLRCCLKTGFGIPASIQRTYSLR